MRLCQKITFTKKQELTDTQKRDHPVENPVNSLPRRRKAAKPVELLMRSLAYVMKSHPQMAGTPPIISAGWRPSNSVTGHADSPPKTAPKGRNACRKEFNVEIKI